MDLLFQLVEAEEEESCAGEDHDDGNEMDDEGQPVDALALALAPSQGDVGWVHLLFLVLGAEAACLEHSRAR